VPDLLTTKKQAFALPISSNSKVVLPSINPNSISRFCVRNVLRDGNQGIPFVFALQQLKSTQLDSWVIA
jgi:hypothetical protein